MWCYRNTGCISRHVLASCSRQRLGILVNTESVNSFTEFISCPRFMSQMIVNLEEEFRPFWR